MLSKNSAASVPPNIPSRTCEGCNKIFLGASNLSGFGSHRAACLAARGGGRGKGENKNISKRFNCCCRTTCPSIAALRDHQSTCPTYQFKVEERQHRHLMYNPESIANEAMHVALDHGEHGDGDDAADVNEGEGGGEEGHSHEGCAGCDMTHADMHIRIAAARKQPLTKAMRHELWVAQFCLKKSLSVESGQEMVDKYNEELSESDKKKKELRCQMYRNILEQIKLNRRYPDIRGYRWDQEVAIDVPAGMNGVEPSQVIFKFADATAVLSSMLQETRLHENKKENIQWDPKQVFVKGTDERVYDADVFSGDWAHRTKATIPVGKDLLAVNVYSDGTNVTGNGRHSAHPVFIQIGNFTEEVRNKDGAYRPIALIPRLNPIESMKSSKELAAFKLEMFHICLAAVLKPLKDMNEKGGWELNVMNNEKKILIPAIAFFTQDSMEVSSPIVVFLSAYFGINIYFYYAPLLYFIIYLYVRYRVPQSVVLNSIRFATALAEFAGSAGSMLTTRGLWPTGESRQK